MDPTDKMITTPTDGNQDANLPSSLQENNESTLSDTTEEDDDATVQTSNSNSTKQAWMSYNIKLLLTNKHDTSDSALQHAMVTILETIDQELGTDVKIFDSNKQQVTHFQVQSVTTFRSKFPVSRSKAHQKHNRSATAWVLFTLQTRQTLKEIRTHPTIAQDVTDITSIGFFVGETPTYKLSSTFKEELCALIVKKAKIHRRRIPKFQVALTVVRARLEHPTTKNLVREASTAFELQVPVDQRSAMEELLDKVFLDSKVNDLNFIYYKERHVHLEVFFRAIQMQRRHEESYQVVAVEGIHPDEFFVFEKTLCKHIVEIESVLPTSKSKAHNNYGQPIGRYNILWKKSNFSIVAKKLHQEFIGLYHQHLQDETVELQEHHQPVRVTSRLPRSDDSSGTIPSMDSRNTFFTHSASVYDASQIDWEYSMDFPSVVETNISAQKQSGPSSPSIASAITGTSPSTLALGSPSYASVVARPTPDPHILELKEQLAEFKTTIQAQQQQIQQPSAPPDPNPHSMSPSDPDMLALREQVAELKTIIQAQQQQLQQMTTVQSPNPPSLNLPPELATTILDIVIASLSNFRAEFQNLHQTTSAPSPARKKVCPNAQTSESHLSEASLAAREDNDAAMDHVSFNSEFRNKQA
jgi:hypothetical protein